MITNGRNKHEVSIQCVLYNTRLLDLYLIINLNKNTINEEDDDICV